jgi:hypothetical protein
MRCCRSRSYFLTPMGYSGLRRGFRRLGVNESHDGAEPDHCLERFVIDQQAPAEPSGAEDLRVHSYVCRAACALILTTPDKSRHGLTLGVGTEATGSLAVSGDAVISAKEGMLQGLTSPLVTRGGNVHLEVKKAGRTTRATTKTAPNGTSFGRAFRNWEGMPPSDWRETYRPTKVM